MEKVKGRNMNEEDDMKRVERGRGMKRMWNEKKEAVGEIGGYKMSWRMKV